MIFHFKVFPVLFVPRLEGFQSPHPPPPLRWGGVALWYEIIIQLQKSLFIPHRRYIYVCSRVHLFIIIFILYRLRQFEFKNTLDDRPLLWSLEFFIVIDEWMDGSNHFSSFLFLDTNIVDSYCIFTNINIYTSVQN